MFIALLQATAASLGPRIAHHTQRTPSPSVEDIPLTATDAVTAGWIAGPSCLASLGTPYTYEVADPDFNHSLIVYYTTFGQITGVGMHYFGNFSEWINNGLATEVIPGVALVTATFRAATDVCSATALTDPVGDRVVINADKMALDIPLTATGIQAANFHYGACLDFMGVHCLRDTVSGADLSWNMSRTDPIVPIYWNGTLSAFFLPSYIPQLPASKGGMWDFNPLPPPAFCTNVCQQQCPSRLSATAASYGTPALNSKHFYFLPEEQRRQVICPPSPTCLAVAPVPWTNGTTMVHVGCCPVPPAPTNESTPTGTGTGTSSVAPTGTGANGASRWYVMGALLIVIAAALY